MSTRGFLGIRNNEKLIDGRFNHWDSYYDALGKNVLELYFDGKGKDIFTLTDSQGTDLDFLYDALFCEYAYIYNIDNDTLEIYRGFFKKKQAFSIKEEMVNSLEDKKDFYSHLILIVDRKKMKIGQVKKAFKEFNNQEASDDEKSPYPEHKVIKLQIPEDYVMLV